MGPDDLPLAWLKTARHLHVTGVFAALTPATLAATQTAMATVRAQGGSISFDPNVRPALWANEHHMRDTLNALAAQADWVLPGLDEGRLLTGCTSPEDMANFFLAQGAQGVVVKLGAQGAYADVAVDAQGCACVGANNAHSRAHSNNARSRENTNNARYRAHVPAVRVAQVVDTVGAGDAFAVGIISGFLEQRQATQALQRALWMGARAVQVRGDSEGLPTRAELEMAQL